MTDLSILIPARNEMFLSRTVADILEHSTADTEVIVALDGAWAEPRLEQNERVHVIRLGSSIGQRAATNAACRLASGRYVMKTDAHCAFAPGFDTDLLADMQDSWTMAPVMRNLHAFDWVCPNGHRRYQDDSGPCKVCGEPTQMEIVWIPKRSPQSRSYCFDPEPHFQYFRQYTHRPEYRAALKDGHISETMSLQGSCFLMTRERYWALNICDESLGSWGSQGIEVACKTWLSGGRVVINQRTWYAHLFRTKGGDFGFPYPISGNQIKHAKQSVRNQFFNNQWAGQTRPLSWLVRKFWPVPGWTQADLDQLPDEPAPSPIPAPARVPQPILSTPQSPARAGIVYYTDNRLEASLLAVCQRQLERAAGERPIISVSLAPLAFGHNICLPLERGYLAMFHQILSGLVALDTEFAFLCEHDVLYSPEHFGFLPPAADRYYYNLNFWKVDAASGRAIHYDAKQTSGLVANRQLLVAHYRERVRRTEAKLAELGDSRAYRNWIRAQGFEPGSHGRAERVDDYGSDIYRSAVPIVDIRHTANLTPSRWTPAEFRNQRSCRNWQESDSVPGWGITRGRFDEFIAQVQYA